MPTSALSLASVVPVVTVASGYGREDQMYAEQQRDTDTAQPIVPDPNRRCPTNSTSVSGSAAIRAARDL